MSCIKFAALVHELVDERLPEKLASELRSHAAECEPCATLLDTDLWLVDAVNQLDIPRPPSQRLTARILQSIEGLAAIERREQVFPPVGDRPAEAVSRENAWVRWVARAALILLSLTVGLVLGRKQATAPEPQQPVSKKEPTKRQPRTGNETRDTHLPNTWRRLARHMNSAQGLARQVLNLKDPAMARPILRHELKQSKLEQETARLRTLLLKAQPPSEGITLYLAKTDNLVQTIDRWVRTDGLPLQQIQAQLRADGLLGQINKLRKHVRVLAPLTTQVTRAAVVYSSDPVMQLFLQSRQHFYRGQRARSLIVLQELDRKFPGHALRVNTRYWQKILSRQVEFHVDLDFEEVRIVSPGKNVIQWASRSGDRQPRLVLGGRAYKLRNPRRTVMAFYDLWRAGQQFKLMRESRLETGHGLRIIGLTFKSAARRDPQVVTKFRLLESVSGIHSGSFPLQLELFAREADCPRYYTPEKRK